MHGCTLYGPGRRSSSLQCPLLVDTLAIYTPPKFNAPSRAASGWKCARRAAALAPPTKRRWGLACLNVARNKKSESCAQNWTRTKTYVPFILVLILIRRKRKCAHLSNANAPTGHRRGRPSASASAATAAPAVGVWSGWWHPRTLHACATHRHKHRPATLDDCPHGSHSAHAHRQHRHTNTFQTAGQPRRHRLACPTPTSSPQLLLCLSPCCSCVPLALEPYPPPQWRHKAVRRCRKRNRAGMHRQRDHRARVGKRQCEPKPSAPVRKLLRTPPVAGLWPRSPRVPLDAAHTREGTRGSGEKAGALRRPVPRHRRRSMPGGST